MKRIGGTEEPQKRMFGRYEPFHPGFQTTVSYYARFAHFKTPFQWKKFEVVHVPW